MQRRMAADSAPILDEEGEEDEDSTSFKDSKIKFASKKRQSLWRSHLCLLIFPMVAIASLVIVGVAVALGLGSGISSRQENLPIDPYLRAQALLSKYPVVDGHNDLAWQIRVHFQNQLDLFDLRLNMSEEDPNTYGREWHTDIPRLQAGRVGVQFWSAFMGCETQHKDATRAYIEQIDIIKRFVSNPNYTFAFSFATSTADIESAIARRRIASLIGVEGGHAIDSSLATLRQMYDLGVRYMTLTHNCNTPWAESCCDEQPLSEGLTDFGQHVVREMNRLGMMVDISHVSPQAMNQVLDVTEAPVIFSHSSAKAICNVSRNVPDDVLMKMPLNGGIVMVNFYPQFVSCSNDASLSQVADHIDHIKRVAGVSHVGIGGDFNGITSTPIGLSDVSKYPYLIAELIRRDYTDREIAAIAHGNLMRVFREVEKVSFELRRRRSPDNILISPAPNNTCRTNNTTF